ncbi:MAG: hypothetical protein ACLT29_03800 [Ruminococcus callidus]
MENTTTLPVFDTTAPYHIKREYYRDGFAAFQKKFVMKRSYVMMALFFILLVSFVVSAVADPSNKTAYFLMMICLAAIFMLWYNPRKQRRMVLDAVRELEFDSSPPAMTARCCASRSCQSDDEEERIPESRVVMATAYVQEFDEFYLVCDEKKMFYILPKSALASPAAELPKRPVRKAVQTARHDCFT